MLKTKDSSRSRFILKYARFQYEFMHVLASIEVFGAANAQSALVTQDGLFHQQTSTDPFPTLRVYGVPIIIPVLMHS